MKAINIGVPWLAILAATVPAMSQMLPDGGEVYRRACATCHEQSNVDRMPQRAVIARMSPENVLAALTTGVMKAPAAGLTVAERRAVAEYLTDKTLGSEGVEWGGTSDGQNYYVPLSDVRIGGRGGRPAEGGGLLPSISQPEIYSGRRHPIPVLQAASTVAQLSHKPRRRCPALSSQARSTDSCGRFPPKMAAWCGPSTRFATTIR